MKRLKTTRGMKALGVMAFAMLVWGSRPAAAKEDIRQSLTPVADADATGQVRLVLRTDSKGRFEIRAGGLDPNATYDIIVGGTKVGTLTTTPDGRARARFRTRVRGNDLLLGFDPRGASVVLRNSAGEDALGTTVSQGGPGGPTDGDVICCVPDDSGAECEDRTPDECAARGGTVSTATSCLPNPCASAPPIDADVICCIPDDAGPECEDRLPTDCALEGGVVVQATSCDPNPCAATPPSDPDIRCCLPDDSGAECEDRTAAQCAAQGGVNMGAGSCLPNPCAGAPVGGDDGPDDGGGGGHGRGHGGGGGNRPYY